MIYRLVLRSGEHAGPPFRRYVDAFNYRARLGIAAMIIEEKAA